MITISTLFTVAAISATAFSTATAPLFEPTPEPQQVLASGEADYSLKLSAMSAMDRYNTCAVATSKSARTRAMDMGNRWAERAYGQYETLKMVGDATDADLAILGLLLESLNACVAHVKSNGL